MITQNALTSETQVDKILGVVTSNTLGTISIGSNTSSTTTFSTSLPACLFEGRFRVSSVGVWTPLSARSFVGAGTGPTDRSVTVSAKTSGGSISVYVNSSSLSSEVIEFEIVLIATSNQGQITPQNFIDQISFNSDLNYLKIADQNATPLTVAAAPFTAPFFTLTTLPISHSLGVVPMYKAWLEYNGQIAREGQDLISLIGIDFGLFPRITTDTLFVDVFNYANGGASSGRDVTIHWRLYYDN